MPRPKNTPHEDGETPAPKRRPSITVQRRLKNPLGSPSVVIPMKDRDMVVRVVDSLLRAGRVAEMRAKGWELVDPGDISGNPEDFGFGLQDGRVVRGERGRDVLMKMHREDFDAIQLGKARENTKGLGGKKAKSAVVEDVARLAPDGQGDEAADFVNRTLTVHDQRAPEPGLEEPST